VFRSWDKDATVRKCVYEFDARDGHSLVVVPLVRVAKGAVSEGTNGLAAEFVGREKLMPIPGVSPLRHDAPGGYVNTLPARVWMLDRSLSML
jgi:hypothetical protein